jgi:hypothetical protein
MGRRHVWLGVAGGWAGLDDHDLHLCRTPTAGSKGLEQGALTLLFDAADRGRRGAWTRAKAVLSRALCVCV